METTPMLKQYFEIKSRHKDAIVFFRLGDFYEMFFEDAKDASSLLDLVLTSRGQDSTGKIPMCGVPYHASDNYIAKLIKAGRKVAICEQIEDPALAKGIVKRDVIRVISAGTYLDEDSHARYLISLYINKTGLGFAFSDTSGGVIWTNECPSTRASIEIISKLAIFECVYPSSQEEQIRYLFDHPLLKLKNIALSPVDDWNFHFDGAQKNLCSHFGVLNLNGFGLDNKPLAIAASGALLEYLRTANKTPLKHLDRMSLYTSDDYVFISPAAHYGLELEEVLTTLDSTLTPMGHRLFRFWMFHPLKNVETILNRQKAIITLNNHSTAAKKLSDCLQSMPDLEKALSRISCGCCSIKDILALRNGLLRAPLIQEHLTTLDSSLLKLDDLVNLRELLSKTINPDVPLAKPAGKIIAQGIDKELDDLRGLGEHIGRVAFLLDGGDLVAKRSTHDRIDDETQRNRAARARDDIALLPGETGVHGESVLPVFDRVGLHLLTPREPCLPPLQDSTTKVSGVLVLVLDDGAAAAVDVVEIVAPGKVLLVAKIVSPLGFRRTDEELVLGAAAAAGLADADVV
ncbi:MAG: hypothetical protein WCH62_01525 [Candidatus Omnitrophota bacterium]